MSPGHANCSDTVTHLTLASMAALAGGAGDGTGVGTNTVSLARGAGDGKGTGTNSVSLARGAGDGKGTGTNSVSLAREVWRLRTSKAERRVREGVKLKTVTDIRRSCACDTVPADSVYFVQNSLWDWDPVERYKQRGDMVSLTFYFQDEASSPVLNATKDNGLRKHAD